MRTSNSLRWLVVVAGAAMLLAVAAACAGETVEVPGETVVVKEEVIKTVEVPGETVVKEVVKEVQVPGETIVVKEEVVKEVMVPGETVVVEKVVTETVEVPGETVTVEVVKEVMVPGETVVVEKEVVKTVEVPGQTVVVEKEVVKTVEVPGETVTVEVVKEVMVPGETVVKEVVKIVEVPGETVVKEVVKIVEVPVAAPSAPSAVNPGKVTFMIASWGNERFDNIHVFDANVQFTAFINTNFVAGNERGDMIPGLVTDWAVSSDGLDWALDFREGVKFHDGSTATIDDYLWTIQHNYGEGCPENCSNSNADFALRIESIEQTGPNQVTVAMKAPDAGMLNLWFSEVGPAVRGVMPKKPSLYGMEEEFDRNPIFAGQMKFVEHVAAERMTFERFDDFYYQPANGLAEDRRMKFQTLDILQVPEESTRAAALRAGQADIAPLSLDTRDQVEAGGGRMMFSDQGGYFMAFFVCCRSTPAEWAIDSPFNNKNIRKAMSYAFDKETMMERLYGGPVVAVAKGWGAVTPGTIGYSADLDPLPFDPDKARQMLADEGYPNGEGFGKVIINTYVSPVHPYLPESAQVAADYWKRELNLDVEVRISEEAATKGQLREGELGGQIVFYDNQARLDAAGITNGLYGRTDVGVRFHDDPAIFEAVQEAVAVFDPETRPQVLNELYKMLWDEQIELAIGYVNTPWGLGSRIDSWEPWPLALHPTGRHTITLR